MSRFIKFIPSADSDFLQENHPNAFLLLCLIAKRARRVSGQLDGLEIGDALLGDYKSAGLSRQQYRTALNKLVELDLVDIIHNGKKFLKREKSTINITIKGVLVNLKSSSIWDINSEECNQHSNQRATNEQPTSNHKQERTRKNKNEKETTTPLTPQGDRVVAFYDCLKENKDLEEHEKEILQRYGEYRVKLALEYAKHIKPSTTLIQMLRWHCSEKVAPSIPTPKRTDQQKMAIDFNAFLLSIGHELMFEQNKTLILEGQIVTPWGSISLNNPISVLRKDFEEMKSEYRQRKYG